VVALPESEDELIRYYTFNETDLSLIRQCRGEANRLGFAVQLCLLRYPGYALGSDAVFPQPFIGWVSRQLGVVPSGWATYGAREETRREHAQELRTYLGLSTFGVADFRALVRSLTELALQSDKGVVLAGHALQKLRGQHIVLPALAVIERACAQSVTRANRRLYRMLVETLTSEHAADSTHY
jgi:TnpA family transposase